MKPQPPNDDGKNHGPLPAICYKPDYTIEKKLTDKLDSLRVNINTQPMERYNKTVAIYVPLFWTGILEYLLNFVTLLQKIIQFQNLFMVPQKFRMTRNLVFGEAI